MTRRILPWLSFLPAAVLLAGCSGVSGPPRTNVSGNVTYKGAPVAQGTITFMPAGSAPDAAPGSAAIKDGSYDTRQGAGPSPGPVRVRIEGFDGKETPDQPAGNPILYWEDKAELPPTDSKKDFVVPANAPKTAPQPKAVIVP
jgi:hypothetical protein